MDRIVKGASASKLFREMPTIHFYPQGVRCPGKFKVLKTRKKKVVTLAIGAFQAQETLLQSQGDGAVHGRRVWGQPLIFDNEDPQESLGSALDI